MARSRRSTAPVPTLADALLALNAATIERASICRLALDAEAWLDASTGDVANGTALAARLGVPARTLAVACTAVRAAAAVADAERAAAAALGARVVTRLDADYPAALRHLPLPPPVLYCRGALPASFGDERRPPSPSSARATRPLTDARRRGSSAATWRAPASSSSRASRAASTRRRTAARSPAAARRWRCSAAASTSPTRAEHHPALADEVAAQGALLAELPLGTPPRKLHFPVRNRLIAALTRATVVVEAAMRSGSLITARCALDLGRDVLALPGRIFDDTAMGTNALLADGARPALHPRDVLATLGIDGAAPAPDTPPPLPGLGARLWEALPAGALRGADELASRCAAPIDETLAELLELELAGWIARLPGPLYCRRG